MQMWMCYVEGVWVNYPALHHNDADSCPAQHNELCGFYPCREEPSYTFAEFEIDLRVAEQICHSNVALGDGRLGNVLSVVRTVIGLLGRGVIQLTDEQLSTMRDIQEGMR